MPDKSLRSEADKIINELREEGARQKEGLDVKRTVIKGSKINKESFGRQLGVGSLSKRVANNEKKISSIKKIIQFNKSNIGDKISSLNGGTETDSDKNIFATGLSKILGTISGIAKSFNNRTKTENKIKDKTRINLNRQRKQQREDVLEGKTDGTGTEGSEKPEVDQSTAPGFLGGIVKFFKSILVGTALLALLKWVQNPDNLKKLQATLDFLSKHGDTIFYGILALVGGNILWKLFKWGKGLSLFFRGSKNFRGGPNFRGDPTRFNRINNRRTISGGQQLEKGPLNRVRQLFRKNPFRTKPPITTSGGVPAPPPVRRGPLQKTLEKIKNIKNPFRTRPTVTGGTPPKTKINLPKNLKLPKGLRLPKGMPKGGGNVGPLAFLFTGLDFMGRKQEGQTNVQAGTGAGGGLAGALAGGSLGAKGGAALGASIGAMFGGVGAVPGAAIGGFIGMIGGSMLGGMAGGKIADSITGVNKTDKALEKKKKAISTKKNVSGRFDMKTGKAYINDQEVSTEEYSAFQNLSEEAKIRQYGITTDTKITGDDASQIADDSSTTKESKLKPYDLVLKHGYKIIDEEDAGTRMVKVYNPNVKYKSGPARDFGSLDGQHPAITMMGTYASKDKVSTEEFINRGRFKKSSKLTWNAEKLNNMSTETVNQLNKKAQGGVIGRAAGGLTDFFTFGMWDFDKRNKKGAPKDWGIRRMAGGVTDWATMGLTDFDKRGKGTLQFESIGSNRGDRISQKVAKKERKINLVPMDQNQIASSSGSGSDQSEIPANASTSGVESDYTSGVYGLLGGYG